MNYFLPNHFISFANSDYCLFSQSIDTAGNIVNAEFQEWERNNFSEISLLKLCSVFTDELMEGWNMSKAFKRFAEDFVAALYNKFPVKYAFIEHHST